MRHGTQTIRERCRRCQECGQPSFRAVPFVTGYLLRGQSLMPSARSSRCLREIRQKAMGRQYLGFPPIDSLDDACTPIDKADKMTIDRIIWLTPGRLGITFHSRYNQKE